MSDSDFSFHAKKRADRLYISKSFANALTGAKLRIASKVIDHREGLQFATLKDEIVLRSTPKGRLEIKATFLEDSRGVTVLTIQKFNSVSGPSERIYFSFVGEEIHNLLNFILGVRTISLGDDHKIHVSDEELQNVILNIGQARQLFSDNEDLFVTLAQSEHLKRDLVAVGYRRKQLDKFERLLHDCEFFETQKQELGTTSEGVWQRFFEENTWIFGYGLSYQFLTSLDGRKLEQIVRGNDVGGAGKRVDALMKTNARINSLCFVEIKKHDTALLAAKSYRVDAWPPSPELCGGVAQVQATVQSAIENLGRKISVYNDRGDPTGHNLFNIEPRSFLVIGRLDEFVTPNGINDSKFRSFEMYRRNVRRPEVVTFDELLHRARLIVEHSAPVPDRRDFGEAF